MNVESIVYDLFQELTRLRERIYELERYKKLVDGELHHIELDIKKKILIKLRMTFLKILRTTLFLTILLQMYFLIII